ncbi:MAG: hypothetical protein IJ880_11260 [Bacilli bacterium]|nr:hypothetical protein [Bacilli bacterium]
MTFKETDTVAAQSLGEMLGMEFNEDGSLSTASDVGNTPLFKKMNRKQRRSNGIYSHKFKTQLKRV